jgi:hypothetical protein
VRTAWRRFGPWLTPAVVLVEVVLVWTGALSLLEAAVILVAVEGLLVSVVLSRAAVAVRSVRRTRMEGAEWWTAVEAGTAEVVPRPLARALLIEARMWVCAAQWSTRRPRAGRAFGYGANVRAMTRIVVTLVVFETLVVESLLFLALGHSSPWVWLALALHLYGLVWILGFHGSLTVLPHRIDDDALTLRDSVFTTVTVPLAVVSQVQARGRGHVGRSGFRIDEGAALLTYGDVNVRVFVESSDRVRVNGAVPPPFRSIDLSLDDRQAFIEALRQQAAGSHRPTGNDSRSTRGHDHGD